MPLNPLGGSKQVNKQSALWETETATRIILLNCCGLLTLTPLPKKLQSGYTAFKCSMFVGESHSLLVAMPLSESV